MDELKHVVITSETKNKLLQIKNEMRKKGVRISAGGIVDQLVREYVRSKV